MLKKLLAALLSGSILMSGIGLPVLANEQDTEEELESFEFVVEEMDNEEAEIVFPEAGEIIEEGAIGTAQWTFDSNGTLTIGSGEYKCLRSYPKDYIEVPIHPWDKYKDSIKRIDGTNKFKAEGYWGFTFADFKDVESINLSGWDISNVSDINGMFYNCYSLTNLNVSNFDTSNISDMSQMFSECSSLTKLDVSNFDTSNVTDMSEMFAGCESLTALDVSNFDTSNVADMGAMFAGCESLTALDVSNFDTSNVSNMVSMFAGCESLTALDVSNFDTSNADDMLEMFKNCKSLTALDVSNFDTSNVSNMRSMFAGCESLTALDVSNFDTSNVSNMLGMFGNCSSLTRLDISNFNTSSIHYQGMMNMFFRCSSLTSLDFSNLNISYSSWITDWRDMFIHCPELKEIKYNRECELIVPHLLDDYKWYQNGKGPYDVLEIPQLSEGQIATLIREDKLGETPSEDEDPSPIPVTNVPLKLKTYEFDKEINVKYSDEYFSKSSFEFNHDLALLSLGVELTSFTILEATKEDPNGNWGDSGSTIAETRRSNIEDAYNQMGFKLKEFYNYDKSLNESKDKAAYSIGIKSNVGNATLVALVVRGGGYGGEWSSNFNVGSSQFHKGFNTAVNEIYDQLMKTISSLDGPIKFWITGYSRGAAIANLLSARLNDLSKTDNRFTRENIYAYTFATPQGVTSKAIAHPSFYANIFNIVNPGDLVPNVAPSKWEFTRYGKNYYLNPLINKDQQKTIDISVESLSGNKFSSLSNINKCAVNSFILDGVMRLFPSTKTASKILNVIKDYEEFNNTKYSVKKDVWLPITYDKYLKDYKNITEADSKETKKTIATLKTIFKSIGISEKIIDSLEFFITLCILRGINFIDLLQVVGRLCLESNSLKLDVGGGILGYILTPNSGIESAHKGYTYFSWMDKLGKDNAYSDCFLKKATISLLSNTASLAQASVKIYNLSGSLLKELFLNRETSNIDSGYDGIIYSVNNGSIEIYLGPGDETDFIIEIEALESGSLNYSITETDLDGNLTSKVNYLDVEVQEGQIFTSPVKVDSTSTPKEDYSLNTVKDGQSISILPTEYLNSDSDYDANLEIKINGAGNVIGQGAYIKGDTASLTALPDSGNIFSGWYLDDNLLSEESTMNFTMIKDSVIEARFVIETSDPQPSNPDNSDSSTSNSSSNDTSSKPSDDNSSTSNSQKPSTSGDSDDNSSTNKPSEDNSSTSSSLKPSTLGGSGGSSSGSSTVLKNEMYRLYNPNSGEHFYTTDTVEKDYLISVGWDYEGLGWKAPKTSNTPVYRLYNENAGDHHYTTDSNEKDTLVRLGWKDEGTGWYSDDNEGRALYRVYNPNATGAGSHHYTLDSDEQAYLVSIGWNPEGIAWYGLK